MEDDAERLSQDDEEGERRKRHERSGMQDDIDARQSEAIDDEAADEGEDEDGGISPDIEPTFSDGMGLNILGYRFLESAGGHEDDEESEIEEEEDGDEVIGVACESIEGTIDVEIDGLHDAHEFEIGNALFLHGYETDADGGRFDDGLNGFIGVSGDEHIGAVDIGEDVSAGLCFHVFGKTFRDIDDGGGVAVIEQIPAFFECIEGSQNFQIGASGEEETDISTDQAIIMIDDVDWDFRDDSCVIDSR